MGLAAMGMASALPSFLTAGEIKKEMPFKLALSQFSLASQYWSKKIDPLDFAQKSASSFGITGLDYCAIFFQDKAKDLNYLNELKKRSADNGCYNLRIMVDGEGVLGSLDKEVRKKAVESHYKWIDAAATIGCPMIRVNAEGNGDPAEVKKAAIESLNGLIDYGRKSNIDVIVENHVGLTCNGGWLADLMKEINNPHCGTLADFGNFCIKRTMPATNDLSGWMNTKCIDEYDRYKGIGELMPFAKGVHAKTHLFDANGNDTETDFARMFKIITDSGFNGWVSIEYEGGLYNMYQKGNKYLGDDAGVLATKRLIEKVVNK
ncbi:Sugar phosphate isomerase/epimerase [Mucilaginibacter sp. OK283]|nr:Sugar phosphate isomerase/epimerase [Mucilaginibacter sp. OK283]